MKILVIILSVFVPIQVANSQTYGEWFQPVFPESQEAQQLLLNWEKLTQIEKILDAMYKGYEIVSNGYNTIKKSISGEF